jgi:hypothetical protein
MGLINYSLGLLLTGLFAFALINFAVYFAIDNSANISISNDTDYSRIKSEINSNISDFKTASDTSLEAFAKSTLSSDSDATEGGTQFKATPYSSLSLVKTVVTASWNKLFGNDANFKILFTALFASFTFVIGFLAWKAWKGSP